MSIIRLVVGTIVLAGLFATPARAQAQAGARMIRVGIIGLDTSHSVAFTKVLNDAKAPPELANCRVVAAYPKGSPDIESSISRVPQYTQQVTAMGVKIVDSIDELLEHVDCVLLETNDGRPHLEQALPVMRAGKRMFIDKPVAGSLADAVAIYDAAKRYNAEIFSCSSLRWIENAQEARAGKWGKVIGASVYSPASLEPTHPDFYWYGIHGVEALFTVMGTGCQRIVRAHTEDTDVVVGTWSDGRIGVMRGLRSGKRGYGGTVFAENDNVEMSRSAGYTPLIIAIVEFFRTGKAPVSAEETLEIYAFMEAADESKRRDGEPVTMAQVMSKARVEAAKLSLR